MTSRKQEGKPAVIPIPSLLPPNGVPKNTEVANGFELTPMVDQRRKMVRCVVPLLRYLCLTHALKLGHVNFLEEE